MIKLINTPEKQSSYETLQKWEVKYEFIKSRIAEPSHYKNILKNEKVMMDWFKLFNRSILDNRLPDNMMLNRLAVFQTDSKILKRIHNK